jgi:hypothetical protein
MRVGEAISVGNVSSRSAYLNNYAVSRDKHMTENCAGVRRKSGLPRASFGRYTSIFAELFMTARDEYDPLAPQREAAFFYGLFLRGHNVEALRQDIDVPRAMLDKWMKAPDFAARFRDDLRRVYAYRKQVLAIFDGLVLNEQNRPPLQ